MKKNLFNFMAILAVMLIGGAILIGSCTAQEPTNYLKVKGAILNEYNANITVYTLNQDSDTWDEVAQKTVSKRYKLRLATDKDYLVLFINDEGDAKAVRITAGDPGMFVEFIDIDFDDTDEAQAYMSQFDEYSYTFETDRNKDYGD